MPSSDVNVNPKPATVTVRHDPGFMLTMLLGLLVIYVSLGLQAIARALNAIAIAIQHLQ